LIGQRFGIISTGIGYKYIHYVELLNLSTISERFAGFVTTGLGVIEGNRQHVETKVKESSANIAAKGADVITLGCTAGIQLLEGLIS